MESNSEIVRLEQFVDNLLGKYKKLKEMFYTLEGKLEEKDRECAKLKETIAELRSERTEVGSRVASLLGRIEQWEIEQDPEGDQAAVEQEGVQGNLFNKKEEKARSSKVETTGQA